MGMYSGRLKKKKKRGVCVRVCGGSGGGGVCKTERGSFQSCQASPASRGEQKTVSRCIEARFTADAAIWGVFRRRATARISAAPAHSHMHTAE